jgi:hypothetical protein
VRAPLLCALLALCLVALSVAPARAASGRIVVVAESTADPALSSVLVRIQGELVAEGFDVVIDSATADRPPESLADAAERNDALAVIGLSYDEPAREVELRVVDRLTNKTLVRRAPFGGAEDSQAAEVLAVRAVDLLRASLLELLAPPRVTPPPLAPALQPQRARAASFAERALPSDSRHAVSVELGAGVLTSLTGVGPAILPVARAQHRVFERFALRVGVAGLGSKPRVDAAQASAQVAQDFAEVGLVLNLLSTHGLRLTGSLAGGLLYTLVEGQAEAPYRARRSALWSALLDGGIGLDLRVSSRFDLCFETHALLADPYPTVRFIQEERARSGLPSLFETVTLAGWP